MIRERNGRLEVIVYLGTDAQGRKRRVSRTVQGTDVAAQREAQDLEARLWAEVLDTRGGAGPGFRAMYGYDQLNRLDWRPAGSLVYRIFAGDVLLYVGVTDNLFARMAAHQARAEFAMATHVEWELYPSREIALIVEASLIAEEHPLYNVVGAAS